MPKKRKRKKKKEIITVIESNLPDVSIEDFANTDKEHFKGLSKKMTSKIPPGKLLQKSTEIAEELPWDVREDFDDIFLEDDTLNETTSENVDSGTSLGSTDLCTSCGSPDLDNAGSLYPDDIWYRISEYILPESVQTFALICKGANHAVNTKGFWMSIYRRFIMTFSQKLPVKLQPLYVQSHPGLKSRVIRALFYVYEPLKAKLKNCASKWVDESAGLLQSAVCTSMWYQQAFLNKDTKVWIFYFKLKNLQMYHQGMQLLPYSCEWFEKADYISENSEINNCILQVTALNFIQIPSVVGLLLTSLFVNVSRGMQYNIVKITFHNERKDKKYHPSNGTQVVLDPVRDVQILHWWNPRYPHNDKWNVSFSSSDSW